MTATWRLFRFVSCIIIYTFTNFIYHLKGLITLHAGGQRRWIYCRRLATDCRPSTASKWPYRYSQVNLHYTSPPIYTANGMTSQYMYHLTYLLPSSSRWWNRLWILDVEQVQGPGRVSLQVWAYDHLSRWFPPLSSWSSPYTRWYMRSYRLVWLKLMMRIRQSSSTVHCQHLQPIQQETEFEHPTPQFPC